MGIKNKPLLLIILIMILLMGIATAGAAAEKPDENKAAAQSTQLKKMFSDVGAAESNALFINYLADRKIISGYPDGSFHPQEGLTRAQAAVVLVKAAGLGTLAVKETGFSDVKAEHWAANSIAAASKAGYLKGYPDGSFHPDEMLTRAQGISLVMRISTQKERPQLPELTDMNQSHWAAGDMALAIAAEMIGLTNNNSQVNPDSAMSRGMLSRALGSLLTKDPGLYVRNMAGTIKDLKGEVKLTRQGVSSLLQNDAQVYAGDTISSSANGSTSIYYPDGSSVLIKENTEIVIIESMGRACIKNDGSSGIAVDNVDMDLKKGTLLGALATKQAMEEKPQAQVGEKLLASMDGLGYIAANVSSKAAPWYQQAEAKKVKMKVDMPYGVASVRGTFIMVSVNQDGSCNVACLTGDAEVAGNSGGSVPLGGGQSSGVTLGGNPIAAGPMLEKDRQEFSSAQQWVVNTALGIDQNREAAAQILLDVQQVTNLTQQAQNTIKVVLDALESSGIKLTEQVKKELEEKLKETQQELSKKLLENIVQNTNPTQGAGGSEESSSVAVINYAVAGTYGPENSATPQVRKNVIISASGVTLQNTVINQDLTLAAGIGNGTVTLNNVKVLGNTYVYGGGPNSVVLQDCELYTVTVDNETNTVRIVAKGNTAVGALTLNSGAKLEESGTSGSGSGFSSVTTGPSIPPGATVILSGNFAAVNIESPGLKIEVAGGNVGQINLAPAAGGTELTLSAGVSVSSMKIEAAVSVGGAGQIMSAQISAPGVVMTAQPLSWTVAEGISATIANQSVTGSGGISSNAQLSNLSLNSGILSPGFDANILEYIVALGYEVDNITIISTVYDSNATVKVNGQSVESGSASQSITLATGSNTITVEVTAPDGSTKEIYTLIVSRAANPAKAITAFSFSGLSPAVNGSINEEAKTIALTVPYGTDVTALLPSITHNGASISPASGAPQDFSGPVSYRVTAADNSTQDYEITVSIADAQTGNIAGHVVNATNQEAVAGATISLWMEEDTGGDPLATAITDGTGTFSITDLAAGTYTGQVSANGYSDASFDVTCEAGETSNRNVSLSPLLASGETRIVMTWGTAPNDLDSHLTGPTADQGRFEVYYGNQSYSDSGTSANLDVDDTSAEGPETTTIISQQASGDYIFSVHNYSRSHDGNAVNLYGSNAKVEVYRGGESTAVETFDVPTAVQNGVWWTVFKLNGNTITPINYISDTFEATGTVQGITGSIQLENDSEELVTSYQVGDLVYVRVADNDLNNPASNDSVAVSLKNNDNNQSINLELTETGLNTGVFLGNARIKKDTSQDNMHLHGAVGDNITATYSDARDASGSPAEASATASVVKGITGEVVVNAVYNGEVFTVNITLNEADLNTDPGSQQEISVNIKSETDSVGFDLTLLETDVNTGIFTGIVGIGESTDPNSTPNILAVISGDTVTVTYEDELNDNGVSETINGTLQLPVAPAQPLQVY